MILKKEIRDFKVVPVRSLTSRKVIEPEIPSSLKINHSPYLRQEDSKARMTSRIFLLTIKANRKIL